MALPGLVVFWVQIDEHGHTFSTELPSATATASPGQVCVGPKTYYLRNVIRLNITGQWTRVDRGTGFSVPVPYSPTQTFWRGSPMGLIEIFIIEFDYFWIDFTSKCTWRKISNLAIGLVRKNCSSENYLFWVLSCRGGFKVYFPSIKSR